MTGSLLCWVKNVGLFQDLKNKILMGKTLEIFSNIEVIAVSYSQ
jgi:hypothetical protein